MFQIFRSDRDGKKPVVPKELLSEIHDRPLTSEEYSSLELWLATSDEAKDEYIHQSIDHANLALTHIAAQSINVPLHADEPIKSIHDQSSIFYLSLVRLLHRSQLFESDENRLRLSRLGASLGVLAAIFLATASLFLHFDTADSLDVDIDSDSPRLHTVNTDPVELQTAGPRIDWSPPAVLPLSAQTPAGELAVRLQRNFDRLEELEYQPKSLFDPKVRHPNWPGDTEGRTALALTLLSQVTDRNAKYIEQIFQRMPGAMNSRGYFGPILPEGQVDEQQLSSHGWVLRALCEYHRWKRTPESLQLLRRIIRNFVLPTRGMLAKYPIDRNERLQLGRWAGLLGKPVNGFTLSSDVGCIFIFMDGVVQAYTVDPSEELFEVIQELIDLFHRTDLAAINAQTHASLTGMRAALTYYGLTGDHSILDDVEKKYAVYKSQAMTENYENYNWFGRPEVTEACGVVDSFLVAVELWRLTGCATYLDDAHHIYFNGISATQRVSGGFGGNVCAGAQGLFLETKVDEAHWCCTMRGGEGLARAAQFAYFTAPNTIFVTTYANNRVRLSVGEADLRITQTSTYPFEGGGRFEIVSSTAVDPIEMRFFCPSFASNFEVEVNGEQIEALEDNGFLVVNFLPSTGDVIEINFELKSGWAEPINQHTLASLRTLRFGPLVLAAVGDQRGRKIPNDPVVRHLGAGAFSAGDVVLTSIYQLVSPPIPKQGKLLQVLF